MTKTMLPVLLKDTAIAFRLGKEAEASDLLQQCITQLQTLLAQNQLPPQAAQRLPAMLQSQQRHDCLGLADTLEHELLPLLSATN